MEIKKIRAANIREALFELKRQFGMDAVILHTATGLQKGVFGIGNKKYVELTVSVDTAVTLPEKPIVYTKPRAVVADNLSGGMRQVLDKYDRQEHLEQLKNDISWIKRSLDALSRNKTEKKTSDVPEELTQTYLGLLEAEVAQDLASDIINRLKQQMPQELPDKNALRAQLHKHICNNLRLCQPIKEIPGRPAKIAFIGPTGVGKTTTIAKLAAEFSLVKKKKVRVITIDTYRIAAVEQIRTYMDIMGVSLEVVMTPDQMQESLSGPDDSDIILIDTAGRSQRNRSQLDELKAFLDAAQPDEIHLVLSSNMNYNTTLDIIEKFSRVRVDKILFTKLDEAVNFGIILNVVAKVGKALSYITNGQSVPDDIEPADAAKLTDMILQKDLYV